MSKITFRIAVLPGDGIGPEVTAEAIKVLKSFSQLEFIFTEALAGGAAIDKFGSPLPDATLELCKNSDAVLLGALGGPKWENLPHIQKPEAGLLRLRKELGLFANLRPIKLFDELASSSVLKKEILQYGIDILIVRELTGDVYFGTPRYIEESASGGKAANTFVYTREEIERIAKVAFELALKRNKRVHSIDKANVLEVSQYWRSIVSEVAKNYAQVELSHMYIDNCAMQIIRYPQQFDVILTSNLFGDIISDEASVLTGSLGMLPSASLREDNFGMYEPAHGSAPDMAGKNTANPIATILSAALMLRYSFKLEKEAKAIEKAVEKTLKEGYRTTDILPGKKTVSTSQMGDAISAKI